MSILIVSCFLLFAYLVSSVPFGLIIVKKKHGIDIRHVGSGNTGATNVFRVAGIKVAMLVFFLDGIKGVIPTLLGVLCFGYNSFEAVLIGSTCILGHMFPPYLKFKGGKGVATSFFIIAIISPAITVVTFLTWLFVFLRFRIVGIASVIASIAFLILSLIFASTIYMKSFGLIVSALIIIRHQSNLREILRKRKENA